MRFERRGKRTVYSNPWIRFEAHAIVHPNGTPGEHGMLISSPPSAVVIVDDDGDVYLTRQARFAVDRVVLEIVKGGREAGESALDAARREAREELGVEAARWDSLGIAYELPSIVEQPVALFLAREVRHVPTQQERVETIETVRMPWDAAIAAASSGELADAVTALALLRAAYFLARCS